MPENLIRSAPPAAVLTAADLSVELGGLPILRGVSLTVRSGESVALLGGNGSGKSTLVRALLGLIATQRGQVHLFEQPLGAFRSWSRIGYVPQQTTATQAEATVEEIVATGRLALRPPFVPARRQDRQAVLEALTVVDLLEHRRSDIRQISGGQQQRTLIARALAGAPELLMLDEPTAGVDVEHQRLLAAVIEQRMSRGMAVVAVLHEVGALGPLIDRAVVLRDGRVVYDGDPQVLAASSSHDHHELVERRDSGWLDGAVEDGPVSR